MPALAQPGQLQAGASAGGGASTMGFTRMRLKKGESSFMTLHYGEASGATASLTNQNDARSTVMVFLLSRPTWA
jgi:hypothetical protein